MLRKHRLTLADGLKVRIFGQLDFYSASGKLSLKMSGLDPRFTLGELALNREELIRRLEADGVLAANAKVPFSPAPLRVGVVTSAASAAWADFQHEIERSGLAFRLYVVDVRVQGEAAAAQISDAVRWFGTSDASAPGRRAGARARRWIADRPRHLRHRGRRDGHRRQPAPGADRPRPRDRSQRRRHGGARRA